MSIDMEKKTSNSTGLSYKEYLEMKHRMREKAFMEANGWKEGEYESK